mmetsp:Transcript_153673/g.373122  ORF Transcript_153673/g.373122 Transcript_153673/m.373122 type:complete len:230 (-) Transcript_153673:316-1005(-)
MIVLLIPTIGSNSCPRNVSHLGKMFLQVLPGGPEGQVPNIYLSDWPFITPTNLLARLIARLHEATSDARNVRRKDALRIIPVWLDIKLHMVAHQQGRLLRLGLCQRRDGGEVHEDRLAAVVGLDPADALEVQPPAHFAGPPPRRRLPRGRRLLVLPWVPVLLLPPALLRPLLRPLLLRLGPLLLLLRPWPQELRQHLLFRGPSQLPECSRRGDSAALAHCGETEFSVGA